MTEFVHKASTPPQRVGNIQYCVFDGSQMQSIAYVNCTQTQLYKPETMDPTPDGVLDRRMGISDQKTKCDTCLQSLKVCPGHFGVVKLELPVFHVGYFRAVLTIIQCVCKTCSRLMIDPNEKAKLLRRIRTPGLSLATRKQIYKKVVTLCKKSTFPRVCAFCGALNGQVRKVGPLKLCHDRYKGGKDDRVRSFYAEFNSAGRFNSEVSTHLSKAQDDITPLRAQQILKAIPPDEIELLDMQGGACKPENLILTHHLVPPVCTRPVVNMDTSGVTNQDDLTVNLRRIIGANSDMRFGVEKGKEVSSIMEGWDFLQLISALVINSEMPSIQTKAQSLNSKTGRGLCQRLKGKQGRIRGNLSGKRVDFTSRTVISPDPNLEIDQVAVPVEAAMKLTYPEIVTAHNIERLRACVRRGATSHPGANYVEKKGSGRKQWLKVMRDLDTLANNLEVGDLVERHLMDDDLCLFNRQPSLHRMSIMCHRAKIKPWRTFRFNECVCAPYNADFDGDEMNLHVPQTEEAKAEASILMGVKRNLITPCNGNPLVAATQDFLTAAFLLSNKDRFYDRGSLAHIVTWAVEGEDVDLPKPAILKPMELWTGKQILSLLIKENKASNVIVNFETAGKTYSGGGGFAPRHMCPKDGYVVVRNSELLCGTFDKKSLGSGTKDNLFHVLLRDFSPDVAASRMCRLSKLCGRWLGSHGFSIGVTDVWPSDPLVAQKEQLVDNGYKECVDFVRQLEDGTILPQPGFTKEQTLEAKMNGALSKVREKAGSACMSALHFLNAPLIMAKCGSKGGVLNISQMAACVGQQTIMGSRIPNGFIDRTLPHFLVHERSPAAKGFVKNSFFSGLTPTEFFFHTMAGREGLVDTAVKTADTGYMQRRLMKALEDMTVNYDTTVRNSEGIVMQLTYGDDGLDPANMESNNTPVSFSHVLDHSLASHPWRPSTLGEAESERGGEGMLGEDEVVGEVLKWMAKEEYLAVATNMVTRDLLYFFLGKEVDKELSAACSPTAPTPLSPTLSHKDSKDTEIQKEEGAEGKRREALEKERKRKVEVAEKRERAERERVVEVNKAIPILLELYKEGKLAGKSFGGLVGKITATRRNFESIADEDEKKDNTWITAALANTASFTKNQIKSFFGMLLVKLRKAVVEPGTPVGAIAGQSIGEPATQMTLKTFHFAGVATMNITLGVPRIKEIINATKTISTPIITAKLVAAGDIRAARVVKARVEKTTLGEISKYIKQTYSPDGCYISVRLDKKAIDALQMDVTATKVKDSILAVPRTKLKPEHVLTTGPYQLQVYPPNSSKDSLFFGLQTLRGFLPTVIVRGIPSITRSVINEVRSKKGKKKYVMMAEGYDLRSVMNTPGVKGEKTTSNHIIEVEETLGIEAARSSIIEQIRVTMQHHGISVDIRHVTLLADVMTFKGTILGITRHGVAKMRESVMTLASFETPTDHLFDAAIHGRKDTICGVSDSVIVGNPMPVGTGLFKVLRDSDLGKKIPKPKPTLLSQRKFRVAPDYL